MIKYAVRLLLTGRVFVCFLACLLPALLPWVMRLIPFSFGTVDFLIADAFIYRISVPMYILSFAASAFVTDPMAVRLAAFFLKLNRDPENLPSPLSVCDCFGPGYLRLVSAMLLKTLRIAVWSVAPLLVCALIPGAWEIVQVSGQSVIRLADWTYLFALVSIFLGLYRGLGYTMVPYILADEPDVSATEALRMSLAMTKGRKWELFVLQMSFFGWMMLVSITFMVAGIYVYPYIEGTMAAYYIAFKMPMPWEDDAAHAA